MIFNKKLLTYQTISVLNCSNLASNILPSNEDLFIKMLILFIQISTASFWLFLYL